MSTVIKTLLSLAITLSYFSGLSFCQDNIDAHLSENKPSENEKILDVKTTSSIDLSTLELKLKDAVEYGRTSEVERLQNEIDGFRSEQNKPFKLETDNPVIHSGTKRNNENDWQVGNNLVHTNYVRNLPGYFNHLDVKMGEDNFLYAAVSGTFSTTTDYGIRFYKSSNYGKTWNIVFGFEPPGIVSSISMLVESSSISSPDSTKLIVFYTLAATSNNDGADIKFYNHRVDGNLNKSGFIAQNVGSTEFSHVSAVSDGAFYSSATYLGVVCTLSDLSFQSTQSIMFFRSADWGSTWTGATLNTGSNDFYPSACFKRSSPDSVYIAVERRFPNESQIRILATSWNPSSAYHTYYLTSGVGAIYEKPSLTVKQNSPADSILLTSTKNGAAVYHFSSNGGAEWNIDFNLAISNGSNKVFTSCSSTPNGTGPFTACWLSSDGDSLNVRRGVIGSMGSSVYKLNNFLATNIVSPKCVAFPTGIVNNSLVIYPGHVSGSPYIVYSNQEGMKTLVLRVIPQAFYNSSANRLNRKDTIYTYIRRNVSPYDILEDGKAVVDSINTKCVINFDALNDGQHYIVAKHRNSIETWSKTPVTFVNFDSTNYDFTITANNAYGNNEVQVDNSPVKFGI